MFPSQVSFLLALLPWLSLCCLSTLILGQRNTQKIYRVIAYLIFHENSVRRSSSVYSRCRYLLLPWGFTRFCTCNLAAAWSFSPLSIFPSHCWYRGCLLCVWRSLERVGFQLISIIDIHLAAWEAQLRHLQLKAISLTRDHTQSIGPIRAQTRRRRSPTRRNKIYAIPRLLWELNKNRSQEKGNFLFILKLRRRSS